MIKKFKYVIIVLLIPCTLLFSACSFSSLKESLGLQNASITNEEIQTLIKGENGENVKDGQNGLNGRDGADGDNIDLYEIYEKIKTDEGYEGKFSDFVKEYLGTEDTVYAASKALRSTVSIFAGGESQVTYMDMMGVFRSFTQKTFCAGSGIIYSLDKTTGDAIIITNHHVVYDSGVDGNICTDINIILYGNEQYSTEIQEYVVDYRTFSQYYYQEFISQYAIKATYLGGSMEYDIAVLKISGSEILKNSEAISTQIANSDEISAGETVLAVGNPSGSGLSVTSGSISRDNEYISMTGVDGITKCTYRVLRTDSAINGGNSGGGLYNTKGELLGIVNAKINSSSIDNIGYAIPSNVAIYAANNIIKNCNGTTSTNIKRCILGITLVASSTTAVYNEATLKTSILETIKVDTITEGGLADGVLNVGDILTGVIIYRLDGSTATLSLTRYYQLVDLSLTLSSGDTIIIHRQNENGEKLLDASIVLTEGCIKICK